MAEEKSQPMYPDANFNASHLWNNKGYKPADAIEFKHYSTTKGILEKEKPGDYEFDVPAELKQAIVKKILVLMWTNKQAKCICGFPLATTISLVVTREVRFSMPKVNWLVWLSDGNWEAMSGDIVFEPDCNVLLMWISVMCFG